MTLVVKLQDGRTESILIPEGLREDLALEAFLKATHPFESGWIKLISGEYTRYSFIATVRVGKS